MAGTPAQKGYNEAGNTDSSRKTVALVAGWPSPNTADTGVSATAGQGGENLSVIASWAMPQSRDGKGASSRTYAERGGGQKGEALPAQAHHLVGWATPKATDGKGQTYEKQPGDRRVELRQQASGVTPTGSPASTGGRGQLHPSHSRWLMGLPSSWDQAAPSKVKAG